MRKLADMLKRGWRALDRTIIGTPTGKLVITLLLVGMGVPAMQAAAEADLLNRALDGLTVDVDAVA